jgi:hypothetical protein
MPSRKPAQKEPKKPKQSTFEQVSAVPFSGIVFPDEIFKGKFGDEIEEAKAAYLAQLSKAGGNPEAVNPVISDAERERRRLQALSDAHYEQAQARRALEAEGQMGVTQQGDGGSNPSQQVAGDSSAVLQEQVQALAERFKPTPPKPVSTHVTRVAAKKVPKSAGGAKGHPSGHDTEEHVVSHGDSDAREAAWLDRLREEAELNLGFRR